MSGWCGASRGAWPAGVALVLLAVVVVAEHDKRSDMSPMPFVMGSRYGRSSPPKMISPRNDRFFMSSRYGKRSELPPGLGGGAGGGAALVCEFTGVFPLYRCLRHDKRDHYDARSSEDTGEREEE